MNVANCRVYLGIINLDDIEESKSRPVSEFIIHPEWNSTSNFWNGDIAIGVIKTLRTFTDLCKPICLNDKPIEKLYSRQGTVTGWSSTNADGSGHSSIGMEFEVTIIDEKRCKDKTPDSLEIAKGKSFCVGQIYKNAACNGEALREFINKILKKMELQAILALYF